MTLDTPEKRRTTAAVGRADPPGATPNAAKDAAWRAQVAGGYPFVELEGAREPDEKDRDDA